MAYPSFEEIIARGDRDKLLTVNRSIRSIISLVFNFFCSVAAVYLLTYLYHSFEPWNYIPVLAYLSPRWFGIIPLIFLLEIFRRRYDDLYIFGEHRITHQNGRLSLSFHLPNIKYLDVRIIDVNQSLMGRLFNYGNVSLGTAAKDDYEVVMSGVYDPRAILELIEDFRDYSTAHHAEEFGSRAVNDGE